MASTNRWKKIFSRSKKPKVEVQVGDEAHLMTETQAYRFDELAQTGSQNQLAANDNPLEESRYSLPEAAFRLMVDEAELLQQAAAGSVRLFADAAGLTGRWRRINGNGEVIESSVRRLGSGYLSLSMASCKELALQGNTSVSLLELPDDCEHAALNLDNETLLEMTGWGEEKKCFCLSESRHVEPGVVFLLPPLPQANS